MSEPKKQRTIQEIQEQYQGLCLRAGHLQYQIHAHEIDLRLVNDQLRDLNLEAASVKAAEEEAKKVTQAKASEEEVASV